MNPRGLVEGLSVICNHLHDALNNTSSLNFAVPTSLVAAPINSNALFNRCTNLQSLHQEEKNPFDLSPQLLRQARLCRALNQICSTSSFFPPFGMDRSRVCSHCKIEQSLKKFVNLRDASKTVQKCLICKQKTQYSTYPLTMIPSFLTSSNLGNRC